MASMLYSHLPSIVGIAGSGQMGTGIAMLCALRGMEVLLADRKHEVVQASMANIKRMLNLRVKKGSVTEEQAQTALKNISPSSSFEPFRHAEFIIEAVSEDEEIKKAVFRQLDQVTKVQAVLASNTSSISITRLAAVTSKPHRVVGMHFQLPVMEQPLVEIAKGMHTSNGTFESSKSLAEHLGKQVAFSEDRPGFVLHRCLMPLINEAFFCLMEGTSAADDIDRCLRLGTAMKQGPLRLADSMGLDTCLAIMRVLHHNLGDSKYRPCPLLAQYVDAGWLGVKTGHGVFQYERDSGDGVLREVKDRHSLSV